jgi:hypothetical protein
MNCFYRCLFPPEPRDGIIGLTEDETAFYFNPYSGEPSLDFPKAERKPHVSDTHLFIVERSYLPFGGGKVPFSSDVILLVANFLRFGRS